MKAAEFEYARPGTVEEACRLLDGAAGVAPQRKTHLGQAFLRGKCRRHGAGTEIAHRDPAGRLA